MAYSQDKISLSKSLKKKYINYTEFGILFGRSYQISQPSYYYSYPVKASANLTFQTFNGLRVYKNLAIGLTVGLDWYSSQQIVPISLGLRNTFGDTDNKKVKPFAGLDVGYGFTWLNETDSEFQKTSGGLALSPVVGLLIPTGGQANFTLSIGYKHNSLQTTTSSGIGDYAYINTIDYHLNRMAIKFGVNF
jgi:hypothetical protein